MAYSLRHRLAATGCILASIFATPSLSLAQSKIVTVPPPATAAPAPAKPAPYDDELSRLSEILGALQYIETLCKSTHQNDWRSDMSKLIASEASTEPKRQEKMTAAYNRGYRSFAATYTACTSNAKLIEKAYRNEGATLAQEIASRFGN